MQLTEVTPSAPDRFRLVSGSSALAAAALAPATHRAYEGALRRLAAWLGDRTLDDASLEAYLEHLHAAGLAPASAALAVAAVRTAARARGLTLHLPGTEAALAGFRRSSPGRGRGQAVGIQWHQADAMAAMADADGSLSGIRDAAIIAVMSDALLRISELAALQTDDLSLNDDGSATITIRRSKTDQTGETAELYLGPPTADRLRKWMRTASICSGVLFRRVRRGGHLGPGPLRPSSVAAVLAKRAAAVGIQGSVRGHSLRVGSAQSLVRAGATLPEIQQDGRWDSSRMPALYSRKEAASKRGTARLRYQANS
ncbi:MAG: tyrosine-type recombinase/integrase [Bryobacterales bacterium]|nr:tyrosine-type recombinase/integrase [Bryobacterales bacterium]